MLLKEIKYRCYSFLTFATMTKKRKPPLLHPKKAKSSTGKKEVSEVIFHLIKQLGETAELPALFDLALPQFEQSVIVRALNKLEAEKKITVHQRGKIEIKPKHHLPPVAPGRTITGVADLTKSGAIYVASPNSDRDIFVHERNTNGALNGDLVKVSIKNFKGRPEGTIVEILKRSQESFEGTVQLTKKGAFFRPYEQKIRKVFRLDETKLGDIEDGQRVFARILRWKTEHGQPDAEIEEVLSKQSLSDIEMKRILIRNGFHLEFPEEVMRECAAIPDAIPPSELKKRADFRKVLTFTIDPTDAKDFDDALSFQILENGEIEVGVHIADVAHYIKKGSALDREGERRATSVYLPDRVCPMLPERLSNELCSLRPNEDKLTFAAIFTFDPKSLEIKTYTIGKTVIHSDKRFAYDDVQAILEAKSGLYYDELSTLDKIAKDIRKKRSANGAISFEKPEVRFRLDETGKPIGVYTRERKDAHLLVEDFMLLANETVAKFGAKLHTEKRPRPFVYRVHDKPDGAKLEQFSEIAKRFGYNVNFTDADAVAGALNILLKKVQGTPEQNTLESLAIRCMAKAEYTTKNIGHYGLAMKFYTHFTSPIRRYPDVLVHRLVHEALTNSDTFISKEDLESDCKNSSIMERKAMDAEREATKYKQVEFLQDKIGEPFAGVITGVIARGIFIELVDNKCEGMISTDSLPGDDFLFDEKRMVLRGIKTKREFKLGDALNVRVLRANLDERKIDLELV